MLSFIRGCPIGFIEGGEHKDDLIRIVDSNEEEGSKSHPVLLLGADFFKRLKKPSGKKISGQDAEEICECLITGELPEDPDLEEPYTEALERYTEVDKKEILLKDGKVTYIPDFEAEEKEQIEIIHIAGPTGVGKSTWIANYCEIVRNEFPDKRIVIFSRLKQDKALDHLDPERVLLDEAFGKAPPEPDKFTDSICIFDDIDTGSDKKIVEAIQKLRDDMMETGRHEKITIISVSHQITNYKKTRTALNEASAVVFFPQGGSIMQLKRFLKEHAGLDSKQSQRILKLPSRWVVFKKRFPQFFLHDRGAITFKAMETQTKAEEREEKKAQEETPTASAPAKRAAPKKKAAPKRVIPPLRRT